MGDPIKVLFIGGTSHVGKTTLAMDLARRLGWQHLSTDQFARHPGRPWRDDGSAVPADVIQHFTTLPVPVLLDAVVSHFRQNVWPIAEAVVRCRLANAFDLPLILEGSAILPELFHPDGFAGTRAVWLTAPEATIAGRITAASNLSERVAGEAEPITAFLERSLQFDRLIRAGADASGLPCLDGTDPRTPDTVCTLLETGRD